MLRFSGIFYFFFKKNYLMCCGFQRTATYNVTFFPSFFMSFNAALKKTAANITHQIKFFPLVPVPLSHPLQYHHHTYSMLHYQYHHLHQYSPPSNTLMRSHKFATSLKSYFRNEYAFCRVEQKLNSSI